MATIDWNLLTTEERNLIECVIRNASNILEATNLAEVMAQEFIHGRHRDADSAVHVSPAHPAGTADAGAGASQKGSLTEAAIASKSGAEARAGAVERVMASEVRKALDERLKHSTNVNPNMCIDDMLGGVNPRRDPLGQGAIGAFDLFQQQVRQQLALALQQQYDAQMWAALMNGLANQHIAHPPVFPDPHENLPRGDTQFGEVIAFRCWYVECARKPYLTSMAAEAKWIPGEVLEGDVDIPTRGVHAFKEFPHMAREYRGRSKRPIIFGEVALWGEIVEHERGYRARYARPVAFRCIEPMNEVNEALLEQICDLYLPHAQPDPDSDAEIQF